MEMEPWTSGFRLVAPPPWVVCLADGNLSSFWVHNKIPAAVGFEPVTSEPRAKSFTTWAILWVQITCFQDIYPCVQVHWVLKNGHFCLKTWTTNFRIPSLCSSSPWNCWQFQTWRPGTFILVFGPMDFKNRRPCQKIWTTNLRMHSPFA